VFTGPDADIKIGPAQIEIAVEFIE